MKTNFKNKLNSPRFLNGIFGVIIIFILYSLVHAATPDPGHPWYQVGDGMWAATGITAYRTFTFPDATATVMTTLDIQQGDLIYGSAASTTTRLAKDTTATHYLSNGSSTNSNNPFWDYINLATGVTGLLGLTNGGTGASLTANNGGILYSGAASLALLSGTSTAGRLVQSGSSAAPTWSTATFPVGAGTAGNLLASNGTNWVATSTIVVATTTTVATKSYGATGVLGTTAMTSTTVFKVGLFNIPQQITVNQIGTSITTVTTAANGLKTCIYNVYGNLLINGTSSTIISNTTATTTISGVTLTPGNYYFAVGCAGTTACSVLINYWTSTTAGPTTTKYPAGKKIYEGTATMTAGTCNATLPAITATISSTAAARLDN